MLVKSAFGKKQKQQDKDRHESDEVKNGMIQRRPRFDLVHEGRGGEERHGHVRGHDLHHHTRAPQGEAVEKGGNDEKQDDENIPGRAVRVEVVEKMKHGFNISPVTPTKVGVHGDKAVDSGFRRNDKLSPE